jgi:hypothetical protein
VVLGLPVNVVIGIIVTIIGAPISRGGVFIRARACMVGVVRRNRASAVWTAPDVRNGALVSLVSPSVAEATKLLLVTFAGIMAHLVTGFTPYPSSVILGVLGSNMAAISTH